MAWWGVAESTFTRSTSSADYAARMKESRAAIDKAMKLTAPQAERVYIEATAKLFSDVEKPDQKALDADYATAMDLTSERMS